MPQITRRIDSIYQDVKAPIHHSIQTLRLPVCRRVWEPGIWEAIWHGRVNHVALENEQGNNRENAKEEGAEGKSAKWPQLVESLVTLVWEKSA